MKKGYMLIRRSGAVPKGVIVMWSGAIAAIPAGWVLCDGNSSTPDLRDKFIVGAKQDDGGVAKTNLTGSLSQAGGSLSHNHDFTTNGHIHAQGPGGSTDDESGVRDYADGAGDTAENYDSGTTDNKDVVPPFYALAFIMKL